MSFSKPLRATSKRRQKHVKQHIEYAIPPFEVTEAFQETMVRKCYLGEDTRRSLLEEVSAEVNKRKIAEDLFMNSLELFRLGEKVITN